MSNQAPSLSRLQLPPTQHTSPNTLVHTFLTQENLSFRSRGVQMYSLGDLELDFSAQLKFMSRSPTTQTLDHEHARRCYTFTRTAEQQRSADKYSLITPHLSLSLSLDRILSTHTRTNTHQHTFTQIGSSPHPPRQRETGPPYYHSGLHGNSQSSHVSVQACQYNTGRRETQRETDEKET